MRPSTDAGAPACIESQHQTVPDLLDAYARAREREESPLGRDILGMSWRNAAIAREEGLPACQDTGVVLVLPGPGPGRCTWRAGTWAEAVKPGSAGGLCPGPLPGLHPGPGDPRESGDNTRRCSTSGWSRATRASHGHAQGLRGENYSRVRLFPPSVGMDGVRAFVVDRGAGGSRSCPPVIVGVVWAGTLELAALTAKRSLLRPLGRRHPDPDLAALEEELLAAVNGLGIGPQGLGGRCTALDVRVETPPPTSPACRWR